MCHNIPVGVVKGGGGGGGGLVIMNGRNCILSCCVCDCWHCCGHNSDDMLK